MEQLSLRRVAMPLAPSVVSAGAVRSCSRARRPGRPGSRFPQSTVHNRAQLSSALVSSQGMRALFFRCRCRCVVVVAIRAARRHVVAQVMITPRTTKNSLLFSAKHVPMLSRTGCRQPKLDPSAAAVIKASDLQRHSGKGLCRSAVALVVRWSHFELKCRAETVTDSPSYRVVGDR